ncbi:HEAT repeat domain-containing protein [candidate division WOR-3 bacterium]|nr:HEAT repeat domain-containing protein [candidate division WOR-3 bacterium]
MMFTFLFVLSLPIMPVELTPLDSLFVRASVGRFDWLDLNQPARESFAEIGDEEVLDFLCGKLENASAREFGAIIEIFKLMNDRARETVLKLMNDPDEEMRISAVYIAGEMKDTTLIKASANLAFDGNWRVRSNAARTLGVAPDTSHLTILHFLLRDSIPSVRLNAIISIGKFQNIPDYIIETASRLLCDSNLFIREKAVDVLLVEDSAAAEILLRNKDIFLEEADQYVLFFIRSEHPASVTVLNDILQNASDQLIHSVLLNVRLYAPDKEEFLDLDMSERSSISPAVAP